MRSLTKTAFTLGAALSFLSLHVSADILQLAKEKECLSCHAIDHEMGKAPSFQSIAKKYPNTDAVVESLALKVRNGGVGHWGPAPMPSAGARPAVNDEESKQLVAWIMSMRQGSNQQ